MTSCVAGKRSLLPYGLVVLTGRSWLVLHRCCFSHIASVSQGSADTPACRLYEEGLVVK
jgi:hypothetical protein